MLKYFILLLLLLLFLNNIKSEIIYRDISNNNQFYIDQFGICNYQYVLIIYENNLNYQIKNISTSNYSINYNSNFDNGVIRLQSNFAFTPSNVTNFKVFIESTSNLNKSVIIENICNNVPTQFNIISPNNLKYSYTSNQLSTTKNLVVKFENDSMIPFSINQGITPDYLNSSFSSIIDQIINTNYFIVKLQSSNPCDYFKTIQYYFNVNSVKKTIDFQSLINKTITNYLPTNSSIPFYPSSTNSYYSIISLINITYSPENQNNSIGVLNYNNINITILPVYDTPSQKTFLSIYNYGATPSSLVFTSGPNSTTDSIVLIKPIHYSLYYLDYSFNLGLNQSMANTYKVELTTFKIIYLSIDGVQVPSAINFPFTSLYKTVNIDYPFGYTKGDENSFDINLSIMISNYTNNIINIKWSTFNIFTQTFPSPPTDNTYPIIKSLNYFNIGSMKIIVEMEIEDLESGFSYFIKDNSILFDTRNLVNGTIFNGKYQFIYDYGFNKKSLNYIVNNGLLSATIDPFLDSFAINNSYYIFPELPITKPRTIQDLVVFTFAFNNIDLTNKGCYNSLFFKFKDELNDKDYKLKFSLLLSPFYNNDQEIYSIWDDTLEIYRINFYLPPNLLKMDISYKVDFGLNFQQSYSNDIFTSVFGSNATLSVYSDAGDMMPPLVTYITPPNNPTGYLTWSFTIFDPINGFDKGEIVIRGTIDQIRHRFIIDSTNKNIYSDIYTVSFQVYDTTISQIYDIVYMKLIDKSGFFSIFNYGDTNINNNVNPLSNFLDSLGNLQFTFTNTLLLPAPTYPTLLNVEISPNTIDIGSDDSGRTVNIFFSISTTSPILNESLPIIYLAIKNLEYFNYTITTDDILFYSNNQVNISKNIIVPYGVGLPEGLTLNIYGIQCQRSTFVSFTTNDLISNGYPYLIGISSFTYNYPIISSASEITSDGGILTLYGKNLNTVLSSSITYSDTNQNVMVTPIIKYNVLLTINIKATDKPFKVFISNEQYDTFIKIIPIENKWKLAIPPPWVPPTSTLPPIPQPIKCSGDPLCGGATKGICTIEGCKCIYPASGIDCSSIIQNFNHTNNETNPTSSYNLTTPNNDYKYSGYVSISSIRELDINNNIVTEYDFKNVKWEFKDETIDNNSIIINTYRGNITSSDQFGNEITTFIIVVMEFFKSSQSISFAGYEFTQDPNTMKYNINISKYLFKSKLNTLQLILESTLESSQTDICSNSEFLEGSSNIMKLQLNDITFYSKYINRGISDNKIVSIKNEQLLNYKNQYQNNNQIKSFIGIRLPYYNDLVQLDPDFSILLENNELNNCKPNGLTKSQLAGIIVGSVVGFIILILFTIAIISKFKYKSNKLLKLHLLFRN